MANFTCSCNGSNNNGNGGVLGDNTNNNGCGCGCGCGCGNNNNNDSISDILGDRDEMSTQDLLTIIAIVLLLIGFFCTGN